MPTDPRSTPSGSGTSRVLSAVVAIAFIALCGVVIVTQTRKSGAPTVPSGGPATAAAPGKAIEVSFHSSSAKKAWVDEMVRTFNASGARVGGSAVHVTVTHVNSGESLEAIKDGKAKPDVWSPGDDSWMQLAAESWRLVKQRPLFTRSEPLVDVPLVMAMWEPMARALGYPAPIAWRDVLRLSSSPRGWGEVGHPEWGRFRWGHAHPDANSGFLTVLALCYAATGKTEGLTDADLKRPEVRAFVRDLERRVEHYGLSNSWLDETMHAKGPSYLSAAVQYENTVVESNLKYGGKPQKLVAAYMKEGTFWTTHPIAVLEEDWVVPEKREGGKLLVEFLRTEKAQRRAMELGLRPALKSVELGAPLDPDHGVDPKSAPEARFQVPDEKVLRRAIELWEDVKVPATIVLVLDRSGSMKGAPMDNAKAGAVDFVKSMKPRDQLEVIAFNQSVNRLAEPCAVKECAEVAAERLSGLFAEGGTALYDAVSAAYRSLLERKKRDPERHYGLVVLSDGKDTSSKTTKNDFLDGLPSGEEWDVPKIYTIAYGAEADRALLREIANRTNARLFDSTKDDIVKTYKELSANF